MSIHVPKKALLMAAAKALQPQDVMAARPYTGNGGNLALDVGIDMLTKGGLFWGKSRANASRHYLIDTVRGEAGELDTGSTAMESAGGSFDTYFDFTTTGALLKQATNLNLSGVSNMAWFFRRAPKFFDIVTYTGDGTNNRQIAHALGAAPGMVIVKCRSTAHGWEVWHRNNGTTATQLMLNRTDAGGSGYGAWVKATSATTFTVDGGSATAGDTFSANDTGRTYVAYLFAHDPATSGIIQCGSYTGNGSTTGPVVNLGWKPQWLMIKAASTTGPWNLLDNARGLGAGADPYLIANGSGAEVGGVDIVSTNATGFQLTNSDTTINASGNTYIYMAIRSRIPTPAEEAINNMLKESFATQLYTSAGESPKTFTAPISPDFVWQKARNTGEQHFLFDKVRGGGKPLNSASTGREASFPAQYAAISGTQVSDGGYNANTTVANWMWKEQPGFFNIVTYTGNGVAGRQIPHSLGVVPGMIITKQRSSAADWQVRHRSIASPQSLQLNQTAAQNNNGAFAQDASTFTPSAADNQNGITYVAYLFAQNPDLIDCGSYVGNGSTTGPVVTCGSGWRPQFIMYKVASGVGEWFMLDTSRGISETGNENMLSANSSAAETSIYDTLKTTTTGFQMTATYGDTNSAGSIYIYMAIREPY